MRLAQRRLHFLAVRICEWVGHPCDQVLYHWACEKIHNKKGSALTDEELNEAILKKFGGRPGVGYAEIAREAAQTYRPRLATLLLEHEPRGYAQVQVMLQLSRSDEENRLLMLRYAAEKAVLSGDPDLVHSVISCACGGDPTGPQVSSQTLLQLIAEQPSDPAKSLHMIGDIFSATLQSSGNLERLRTFHDQLGHSRRAAQTAVMEVFSKREAQQRMASLPFAKDFFAPSDPSVGEAERLSMQFCGQACTEEKDLLQAQVALEEESVLKRWLNGPHRFCGLSLVDTLRKLMELGEIVEADKLRANRVSDKRYWRIKVRALSDAGNISALDDLTQRTSPIGYELFVDAFLKHGRTELALPLIPKIKNAEAQANFYSKMGMEEEAQRARDQGGRAQAGPGRILQSLGLRLGN